MNRLAQEAILARLARRLQEQGSWGGETHLQKAAYLLSELQGISFDFDFILYKHGPFSFELRDELASMEGDGWLTSFSPNPRYGPRLYVTQSGETLEESFSKTMDRYGNSIDWVASTLGNRGVMELERLATAMWITREHPDSSISDRVAELVHIKPHIDENDAEQAVEEVDRLLAESENIS